ncbi:hypothetical protein LCGC14_2384240 [marine sediment metagenome]|uniref:Uncharacterized protein n=1 Tax=marine sediment metagenome TaxID=412755 RepID=A0A0F9C019_9ZZZZ
MNIQRSLNNLESFFSYKPWELKVKKKSLEKASFIYKTYYWVISFFSTKHTYDVDIYISGVKIKKNLLQREL